MTRSILVVTEHGTASSADLENVFAGCVLLARDPCTYLNLSGMSCVLEAETGSSVTRDGKYVSTDGCQQNDLP